MNDSKQKKHKRPKRPKLPPYIVRKGEDWHARVSFATKLRDKNGKIVYEQMTRKCEPKTKERAAELVAWMRAEWTSVKPATSPSQTLGDFLEYFLTVKKESVTQRTYEFYAYLFEKHLKDKAILQDALTAIRTLDLQRFFSTMEASPERKRKVYTFLSMALKQAIFWDLLTKNPITGVVLPKAKSAESLSMAAQEARRFMQACRKSDDYIIFEFALETGLRPQETLGIRWQDIDLDKCRVSVRQAVAQGFVKGGFQVKDPKTDSSRRTIGITPQLRDRLLRHRELQNEYLETVRADFDAPLASQKKARGANYKARRLRRKLAGEKLADFEKYDLVFPSENGKPQSMNNLNRREFKVVLKLAGIDPAKYSLKNLRHSSATLMLSAGVNIKVVSQKLGHASITTSLRSYAHVLPDMDDQAAHVLSKLLYDK